MPEENGQPSQVKAAQTAFQLAASVLGQVGFWTLGLITVALLGGLALDRLLDTRPLFTILLTLGSFPLMFYIIYRVAMRAVARIEPGPSEPRAKEDGKRD